MCLPHRINSRSLNKKWDAPKIDKLWDLTRISNKADRLIVTVILVKGLVPGGTDPILAISGYAGSGKTTTANCLRSLIDPFTKGKVLSKLSESSDRIAIHAQRRRILAIDNVSHISADRSDFLCTVSTGGGIGKRELFSDQGEVILDVQNLIILTSIGNVVTKVDLLERAVVIELARLTPKDRESESYLANGFDRDLADILGGLLNITVAALQHRDTTECPKYTRMTEFAHLGEGVQKYLKFAIGSVKSRMAAGAEIANEIAIESSPVASTLRSWISTQEAIWQGSASDLLNILKSHAKKSELAGTLPKTANSLSGELKKCESALFQSGSVEKPNMTKSIPINNSSDDDVDRHLDRIRLKTVDGKVRTDISNIKLVKHEHYNSFRWTTAPGARIAAAALKGIAYHPRQSIAIGEWYDPVREPNADGVIVNKKVNNGCGVKVSIPDVLPVVWVDDSKIDLTHFPPPTEPVDSLPRHIQPYVDVTKAYLDIETTG